jgi:hypothetical protein
MKIMSDTHELVRPLLVPAELVAIPPPVWPRLHQRYLRDPSGPAERRRRTNAAAGVIRVATCSHTD